MSEATNKLPLNPTCPSCGMELDWPGDPISYGGTKHTRETCLELQLAAAKEENARLKAVVEDVNSFLRAWMPDDKGPMARQFAKMIGKVDAARTASNNKKARSK